MLRSAYKGEPLGKTPPCVLCGGPGRGRRAELQLPYGIKVWLCAGHRDPEFLARRSGRDLVTSLMHAWLAAGCLDRRRSDALTAHLRRVQGADALQDLPGSYAWPSLRAEAERRFAAGEPPGQVIADLRGRGGDGPALPPPCVREPVVRRGALARHPPGGRPAARSIGRGVVGRSVARLRSSAPMEVSAWADVLREGDEALAAADWERARACFARVLEQRERPEALTGLSKIAMIEREYERAIELKERAFELYRRAGRRAEASDIASWVTFMYATYHGNFSVALGWKERAARALEGVEECAAHGWLELLNAPFSRDPAERERLAVSALAIARRFEDADLEIEALALLGESFVVGGRVADGMRMLDEAMAAITAGRVRDHFALGEIYCRLLSACEAALDVRRASDWLAIVDRYVVWTDFVRPTCQTHYGGILIAMGRWPEAEAELLAAIDAFDRGYRGDRGFPALRLADLRLRQGRVEEAERLLEGGEWHPAARRMAATIALVRGDSALASELGELCAEGTERADPTCAPALELLALTRLAIGDVAGARDAADRLAAIARETGLERLEACAALAGGRVHAAQGDGRATAELTRAAELFASLGLPLEAARAQLELGRSLAESAPSAAAREAKLALAAFERLGALRDADAAAALLRGLGAAAGRAWPRGAAGLTRREREVLGLLGEGCSNAQIAERLVISPRTAEHHVASILSKLGLRSRSEATAHAVRHGV
jgi:DNA-binding CsgD family transcriptional regulator